MLCDPNQFHVHISCNNPDLVRLLRARLEAHLLGTGVELIPTVYDSANALADALLRHPPVDLVIVWNEREAKADQPAEYMEINRLMNRVDLLGSQPKPFPVALITMTSAQVRDSGALDRFSLSCWLHISMVNYTLSTTNAAASWNIRHQTGGVIPFMDRLLRRTAA
jgi:hypothetical protein